MKKRTTYSILLSSGLLLLLTASTFVEGDTRYITLTSKVDPLLHIAITEKLDDPSYQPFSPYSTYATLFSYPITLQRDAPVLLKHSEAKGIKGARPTYVLKKKGETFKVRKIKNMSDMSPTKEYSVKIDVTFEPEKHYQLIENKKGDTDFRIIKDEA